ncbi:hypothetical protein [Gottfriedia solisilvae]|uniref:Uncharacterized protein n=1 Tax=Gottfriedia solisilvae TaxID=1516104 RepID=A0A8J3ACT7_9BACI|nr:hypothetical protein [Gottfriedia solisilvae]GGI11524.1 hypothetical protein GCM10007380_08270 [Gottfriedia solisilvae]
MSLEFCISNTINGAAYADRYVAFEDELHDYLIKEEKFYVRQKIKEFKRIDLILGLDPYGDKIFNEQEIIELIKICEYITNNYKKDCNDLKIFSKELKELCLDALETGKKIVAAGD